MNKNTHPAIIHQFGNDQAGFSIQEAGADFLLRAWPYNPDLNHDIKLLPRHARRWDQSERAWRISCLYFGGIADFIKAHYGLDLTPERDDQSETIRLLGTVDEQNIMTDQKG